MAEKDRDRAFDDTGALASGFRPKYLPQPDLSVETSGAGLPSGAAVLVVRRGPTGGFRMVLDKAVTSVGRHPDSDLVLDDTTVSRRHAEFRVQGADVQIVDVGSLTGTWVNRVPVDYATLADGDEVQLGKFRLIFLSPQLDTG